MRSRPHDPASETYAILDHKFELELGVAAYTNFDTSIRIGRSIGAGAILDFEDLLGLDKRSQVGRLDAHYNFNERHRINFSIYDIKRSGTQSVNEDLEIGDVIIPAGQVDSYLNTQIWKLAYQYNFVHDYRTRIGASLGLHVMRIDTGIHSATFGVEETFEVTAPLPLLGLHGIYALSEKWRLRATAEVLQLKIGEYGGFITDTILAIDNDLTKYVGWGVGLNSFQMSADFEDDGLNMEMDYGYQGLMIYLRGYL